MKPFKEIYKDQNLLFDGAMGTSIQKLDLESVEVPELLNLIAPDELLKIHKKFIEAGSNVIETNTFGATRSRLELYGLEDKLEEINRTAVRIAKDAADEKIYIAGSVGPLGKIIEPYGELPKVEALKIFSDQIEILLDEGVDLILIETMISLDEALIALEAAKSRGSQVTGVTMTFDEAEQGIFTSYGETPAQCAEKLKEAGADFIGANCGHGFESMIKFGKEMRQATKLPILIQPNAGLPKVENRKLIYEESIENYQKLVEDLFEADINFIGGCCGTTPEYIEAASQVLKSRNIYSDLK